MMNRGKIANLLMVLLLMLQVLVIPMGVISADTTPAASAVGGGVELFSIKQGSETPTEKLSISSYSGDYKITAKLNNQTQESFDGGKIRVRLDRRDFDQPTAEGLAKPADNDFADKLEGGTVITTDPKDWIIEYSLKQVSAGENLEIPSVVQPKRSNVDQTRGTITEEILDQHDQVVTTANKGYYIDSSPLVDRGFSMSQVTVTNQYSDLNYYYNYQDKEDQLKPNGDGSYTTLSDQTTNMYVVYLYGTNDSRNIEVTMDLSKLSVLKFNADAPNGWTYDATTKKATRTFTPSEFLGDRPQRYLPLKVSKGSQLTFNTNDEYQERIGYEVQYEGSNVPITTNRSWLATITLKSGQNWSPVPEGNAVQAETNRNQAELADVTAQTKLRYSVQAADQMVNSFQHIPAGVELPVSMLKAKLATDFYQDNKLQSFALEVAKTPNLPGMTDNHLYGINADGSKELLKDNLGVTPWDASQLTKKYQGFQLEFDHPIMVTNEDAAFGFNIVTTMTEQSLQDFRKDASKNVKYYELDTVYAQYPGFYKDALERGRGYVRFNLYKYKSGSSQPADISSDDKEDQLNVVNGHDFTIKRNLILRNNYANTQLENGKVYFMVPEHTRLAADQSGLKGLAKPQIIPNFHNSGRTAIVADLLPVDSAKNGYSRYDISLPLDAAQLRQGDNYQIEGYVVYNNNDGSYDLTNPAGSKSIVTPTLTGGDNYQLYTDTKDPTKGFKLANTKLNYMPIAGLKVSNLVAKGDGGYSSDLGAYGYAGDVIKYRTNLYNGYSEAAKKIGLVNYLPVAGANGSKFDVKLAGPVTIKNQTGTASPFDYEKAFTVYYATAKPSYGAGDYSNSVVWQTAAQLSPTDYPKVTMLKLVLDPAVPFDPKAEVNFDYPAQITTVATPENSQAINQVQLVNSSGSYYNVNQAKVTMNYPVNAVQTTKVDRVSHQPLYGAKFKLLDSTGATIGTQLYETNTTGQFQISNLKAGNYYLVEVAAPDGYVLPQGDEAKTAFTIGTTANTPTTVKITNVSKANPQGSVLISNQDRATGKPLNGGSFSLSRVTAIGETSVDENLTITANGKHSHSGLLPGKYRVRQKAPAKGYLLNSQVFDFTVNSGEISNVLVKSAAISEPVKTQVTIINHEKGQPTKPIVGSEFELIDQKTGKVVANKLVTDKHGQIGQTDLPTGDYQIKQISVPSGYILNSEPQAVTLSQANPKVTTKFENAVKPVTPEPVKGQLTIINHEKNHPTKLIAGSEFILIDQKTGKKIVDKLVTDKNGQIIQKNLPIGEYQIKQVSVPTGYLLNTASQLVKVSKQTPTVTVKVANAVKISTSKPDVDQTQPPAINKKTKTRENAADTIQSTKTKTSAKTKSATIKHKSKSQNLPQSNEQFSKGLLVLGILLLILVLGYAWKKSSKH